MDTTPVTAEIPKDLQERAMFCQKCLQRTPVHMLWFKAVVKKDTEITIAQMVCDECLECAVASMDAARQARRALGQVPTFIRESRL